MPGVNRPSTLRRSAALAVAALALGPAQASRQERGFVNAQIVDPASRTITRGALLVRDGHIASIGPSLPADFRSERSMHRELELLVGAGLSPGDALRAATTNAAKFLDRPWGVRVGDEASFIVLDGSPIDDITSTRKIRAVWFRGEKVLRDGLLPH